MADPESLGPGGFGGLTDSAVSRRSAAAGSVSASRRSASGRSDGSPVGRAGSSDTAAGEESEKSRRRIRP
eukprot:scaffold509974_cov52-Prasinocladus_malaysianus.AAC.2